MVKNLSGLEIKVEDQIISIICDSQCPIPHIRSALIHFGTIVDQIEENAKKQMEEKKDSQPVEGENACK